MSVFSSWGSTSALQISLKPQEPLLAWTSAQGRPRGPGSVGAPRRGLLSPSPSPCSLLPAPRDSGGNIPEPQRGWSLRSTAAEQPGPLRFPHSSAGKDSTCNTGDPGSIPGSGRSPGERKGYPLQYSWASLVAQLVKNLPAMRETPVPFLGWEDPLEEGKASHSGILTWRIPWTDRMVHGVAESGT